MLTGGRLLQRAEDDAMRTAISFSHRQVGATDAGSFCFRCFRPDSSARGRDGVDRRMNLGPNPDEIEEPSATGPNFTIRMTKRGPGGLVGETSGDALMSVSCYAHRHRYTVIDGVDFAYAIAADCTDGLLICGYTTTKDMACHARGCILASVRTDEAQAIRASLVMGGRSG
ncbi:hypothetical protein QYE76_067369 [Lolium multiflorum]|uniref:Uncharacterized protein n=1 Tax=Lolium multiflorum TaxID=4521 RepID=A0AAD8WCX4_LOLMU|nr:hypothetical protein QYE76_067369 [Lolium multiflorum]